LVRSCRGMPANFAHCRTADRPGTVWLHLSLLGANFDLPDELLLKIHEHVFTSSADEREGMQIFMERRMRQERERTSRGAERAVKLWNLLGFSSLNEFICNKRAQKAREDAESLPTWAKFGFESDGQYKRARRAERKRTRRVRGGATAE